LARRSARQQRLVELLCAVGAVLRVPAAQVQCRMSPTTGAAVWAASPAAAAHAAAQAEASLLQLARAKHTASGAVAHQARDKRAQSLAAPNARASALCGGAVLGDAVVTLPGAVDGLAGLALGNRGEDDDAPDSAGLGAALHLAPVRFRREFLLARATATPPFEPHHCRRIRKDAAVRAAAAKALGTGDERRGSSRSRPPVLKRPPPRLPSHRAAAATAGTAGISDGAESGTLAEVAAEGGAAQALAAAAFALRREVAADLGRRLRGCGDLTQHRSPYEEEAGSSSSSSSGDEGEDFENTSGARESGAVGGSSRRSGRRGSAAAAAASAATSFVAVFHGGHAVALAHAAGVNVCLLPCVLACVPATEASVHHLLRAELVARAAKHSLRVIKTSFLIEKKNKS
jgi:hypothetical protein